MSDVDVKELRTEIEEIRYRIDNRIKMFYKEVKNTSEDLDRLSSLYEELEKTSDDPVFKIGCDASINEIYRRVRAEYNDKISKIFKSFW